MIENGNLSYTYPKDVSKTDITYQIEISTDLDSWTPIADALVETNGSIETRNISIPLNGERVFVRLKVIR